MRRSKQRALSTTNRNGRKPPRRRVGTDLQPVHAVYEKCDLRVDFDAYEVSLGGERIHLHLREFRILCLLVQAPNRVFSREQIVQLAWRRKVHIDPRTIDVHMCRLRRRLERDPAHPKLIMTVRGVGYKFDDRSLAAPLRSAGPGDSVPPAPASAPGADTQDGTNSASAAR